MNSEDILQRMLFQLNQTENKSNGHCKKNIEMYIDGGGKNLQNLCKIDIDLRCQDYRIETSRAKQIIQAT